jgi:protein phosphatase
MLLKRGDILLLCSDGLTDLVSDGEILRVIRKNPLAKVPDILIDLVNQRGGHDNTTLILMQMPRKMKTRFGAAPKRRWLVGCLAVLVFLSLLVTAILFGLSGRYRLWFGQETEPVHTATEWFHEATSTVQLTNTLESTATPSEVTVTPAEIGTPGPTITPWPTDTQVP